MVQLQVAERATLGRDHTQTAVTRADRLDEMLSRYLGTTIVQAMADDDVTEVYVNPQDGTVRFDTRTHGRSDTGQRIDAHRVEMFLNAVAARLGVTLTSEHPRLEAELPIGVFAGSRLQGFVPPVTNGPAFNIRKLPRAVYSLDDYRSGQSLTVRQHAALRAAIADRHNILVVGGTNTGKTTFANALLREITERCPRERLVVLEDTVELQCAAHDHLALRTNERVSLADLVRSALRTSPNRIIVGEVRGAEALDLLDAWATGHPGGVATLHATSAEGALLRLDRLAQRANVPPQTALVADAINLIVVLQGDSTARRVTDLARVSGLTSDRRFILHHLTSEGEWL